MSAAALKEAEPAVPEQEAQAEIRPPEREPTLAERMDWLRCHAVGETANGHLDKVLEALTSFDVDDERRRFALVDARPAAVQTLKANAAGWREEVKKGLIVYVYDSLKLGQCITRAELKVRAGQLCQIRGFKGKQLDPKAEPWEPPPRIQDPTIERWLTMKLEQEIRDAAAALISADSSHKSMNRY